MSNGLLTQDADLQLREECTILPDRLPELPRIHQALKIGCCFIACLTAEGTMVALVAEKYTGSAKYPDIGGALSILEEEITIPAVSFPKQSNRSGTPCTRSLTSMCSTARIFDEWVSRGYTVSVKWQKGKYVCILEADRQLQTPEWVVNQAKQNPGVEVPWRCPDRGHFYYSILPEGSDRKEPTTHLYSPSRGKDPWKWKVTKTGYGRTLWEAFKVAVQAPEVEGLISRTPAIPF